MTETPRSEINPLPLAELQERLAGMEAVAAEGLGTSLKRAGVSPDVAARYKDLFPDPTGETSKAGASISLAILGKRAWEGIRHNRLTQAILLGLTVHTAGRVMIEGQGDPVKGFTIFLDNLLKWSGSTIQSPNFLVFLTATGAAAVYAGAPAKVIEWITSFQSKRTAEQVKRDAHEMEIRSQKEQAIKEGRADLDGRVGPNIQIDVGNSDPSMGGLLTLFHAAGLRVVSYWDSENQFFEIDPAWQRTNNDWTNKESLRRGDVREALCSVVLVSNGDDVFLSQIRQDPTRKMQDMTDNEAIGSIHARDSLRKRMGKPPIQHILVSNPQRTIEIGIARIGDTPYKPKTVDQLVGELPNVHLIDPDISVVRQLAEIAAQQNLPLELITNKERLDEYQQSLGKVIERYNQMVDDGTEKNKVRIATPEDGRNTLTIIYGATDEDTVAQMTTYGEDFSTPGGLVAIINDPEKTTRLPEGTKSICVGTTVAEAVYQRFFELVSQGIIET